MINARMAYVYYLYHKKLDAFYVRGADYKTKWTKDTDKISVWSNKQGPAIARARYLKRHQKENPEDLIILEQIVDLSALLELYHINYTIRTRQDCK